MKKLSPAREYKSHNQTLGKNDRGIRLNVIEGGYHRHKDDADDEIFLDRHACAAS